MLRVSSTDLTSSQKQDSSDLESPTGLRSIYFSDEVALMIMPQAIVSNDLQVLAFLTFLNNFIVVTT